MPIVRALENDSYSKGESDITATSLIEPVRIRALKERHKEELVQDAADLIHILQGKSIHTILEGAGLSLEKDGLIVEKRFYIDVPLLDGTSWKVGAQVDLFDANNALLQDYKVTSAHSVKGSPKEEYVKQLNIGAHILRKNGYKVEKLQIVAILRDWSKNEYKREKKRAEELGYSKPFYPSQQVVVLDIPVVDDNEVALYIEERVIEHKKAALSKEPALPVCTPEERWERRGDVAIIEEGKKRATKVFSSREEAELSLPFFQDKTKKTLTIVERPGESVRCTTYCPVASKCSIAKKNGWIKTDEKD